MTYPKSQSRTTYDDQAGPFLNVGSISVPEVLSFNPSRGPQGTKLFVYITTLYELVTSSTPSFSLMFGQRKVPARLNKLNEQGAVCQYAVTADVPQLPVTGWASSPILISMVMEGDGDVVAKVDVGEFTYVDTGAQSTGSTLENSRKRKLSADSELMRSPTKRVASQQLRPKEEYGASYAYGQESLPSYSPYLQPNHGLQPAQAYGGLQSQRSVSTYEPSRSTGYGYPYSSAEPVQRTKTESPQVTNWGSSYSSVINLARSPGVPDTRRPRPSLSSLPSPGLATNPPLIRTTELQQRSSPASSPHGGHPGSQYNAYPLYPKKAKLEINGDLDAMVSNWTDEEWESKRRIVQFNRTQLGSTITITFHPVTADERPPHAVCISCIYWEERKECFVTSVDTIYLLEQLVAAPARFTTEEKNRIRRNLEGFRPFTVSKAKPDSEEFFKVIMAFPTPKPRHIEKDVKVFHWKDLTAALKKIVGKYVSLLDFQKVIY